MLCILFHIKIQKKIFTCCFDSLFPSLKPMISAVKEYSNMLSFSLVKELHINLMLVFWLIDRLGWYLMVEINLRILKGKSINTVVRIVSSMYHH